MKKMFFSVILGIIGYTSSTNIYPQPTVWPTNYNTASVRPRVQSKKFENRILVEPVSILDPVVGLEFEKYELNVKIEEWI